MSEDRSQPRRAQQAADILSAHETVICAALKCHCENMTAVARRSQAVWEQLAADPAAQIAHDTSSAMITARRYQAVAAIFQDYANAATAALDALEEFAEDSSQLAEPAQMS